MQTKQRTRKNAAMEHVAKKLGCGWDDWAKKHCTVVSDFLDDNAEEEAPKVKFDAYQEIDAGDSESDGEGAEEKQPRGGNQKKKSSKRPKRGDDRGDEEFAPFEKSKPRATAITNYLRPSQFLALFGSKLLEFAQHKRVAVHQTFQEQLLKEKLTSRPEGETPIIVDMDFAENYEIAHKVEIQSEHWSHQQVTLYIVITHRRERLEDSDEGAEGAEEYKIVSEAHVYASSDKHHDTYFVQHVMQDLQRHYRERGLTFSHWYINTDGAASHFKQRYTFFSMFKFRKLAEAVSVMWETCAPGHGKGPWDGIGAVVKRLLRDAEVKDRLYASSALDVYRYLVEQNEDWKQQIGAKRLVNSFVFHYVPVADEDTSSLSALPEAHVLKPIMRPKSKAVTAVPDIRSNFCFDFEIDMKGRYYVRRRELSCHCDPCLDRNWADCELTKKVTGKWKRSNEMTKKNTGMNYTPRSAIAELSNQRRLLGRNAAPGSIVSLEANDDPEGFGFWLAEVVEKATEYRGTNRTLDGVKLRKAHWYITVQIIDRFPSDCSTIFRKANRAKPWKVNCEGVTCNDVKLEDADMPNSRKTRASNASSATQGKLLRLPGGELQRLEREAENRIDAP